MIFGSFLREAAFFNAKKHEALKNNFAEISGKEVEATGEDVMGRMLVANVILNRVESEAFPDTIKEVVFQKNTRAFQFSPAKNGMLYHVSVSEETKEAVERALRGEDNAKGALYFVAPKAVEPDKMRWFDSHLTRLFQYGGHAFFS